MFLGLVGYIAGTAAILSRKKITGKKILLAIIGLVLGIGAPIMLPITLGLLAMGPRNEKAERQHQQMLQDKARKKEIRQLVADRRKCRDAKVFLGLLEAAGISMIARKSEENRYEVGFADKDKRIFWAKDIYKDKENPFLKPDDFFTKDFYELISLKSDVTDNKPQLGPEEKNPIVNQVRVSVPEVATKPQLTPEEQLQRQPEIDVVRSVKDGACIFILPDYLSQSKELQQSIKDGIKYYVSKSYFCFEKDKEGVLQQCSLRGGNGTCVKPNADYQLERCKIDIQGLVAMSWAYNEEMRAAISNIQATQADIDRSLQESTQSKEAMRYKNACTFESPSQNTVNIVSDGKAVVKGELQEDGNIRVTLEGNDIDRFRLEQKGIMVGDHFQECVMRPDDFCRIAKDLCLSEPNVNAAKLDQDYLNKRNEELKSRRQPQQGPKQQNVKSSHQRIS